MSRAADVTHVSSRGQVVIPARLRRRLGLVAGRALAVAPAAGGGVVLVPLELGWRDSRRLLEGARSWVDRRGRDLVEELHARRQAERARHEAIHGRRGP